MAFMEACQMLVAGLPVDGADRRILEYLLENAVGRGNLKSWTEIEAALTEQGVTDLPTKENFQTGLLSRTRESDAFIGSSPKGYFVINSREDAYVTRDFYINRITTEARRLEHLQRLIEREYPL